MGEQNSLVDDRWFFGFGVLVLRWLVLRTTRAPWYHDPSEQQGSTTQGHEKFEH